MPQVPAESKKTVIVTLESRELTFEIMNKTHVTARSLESAGKLSKESAANIQANGDSENAYEMWRALTTAIGEAKVELSEYLYDANGVSTADNKISSAVENGQAVTLTFKLPTNADTVAADALGSGINDFVIFRSIYNWYRQTAPELAAACATDAEAVLERTKKALYKRSRPERPTYNS
jgi:hypothetical protein